MNNFGRALRSSLRYRYSIAAAFVCSLMVALLWGANIAALGPVAEVLLDPRGGRTLQQWAEERAESASAKAAEAAGRLQILEHPNPTGPPPAPGAKTLWQGQLQLAEKESAFYRGLQPWLDRFFPRDAFGTLTVMMGMLAVATLIKCGFLVVGNLLVDRVAQGTRRDLQNEFYEHVLTLDLAAFRKNSSSDWMARFTTDLAAVSQGVQIIYGRMIREPLKMAACAIGAAVICWRLFLFSLIAVPLCALAMRQLTRALRRASRRALEEVGELYNMLAETLGSFPVVKAYTMEPGEAQRFVRISAELYRKNMKISAYNALLRPSIELVGLMIISSATLAGAYLALNQQTHLFGILPMSDEPLTLPMLMVFYGMLAGMSDPGRKISSVIGALQTAAAAADRVNELRDRQPSINESEAGALVLPNHQRDIVFRNVHFRYRSDCPVLQGVQLRIAFGETVAFVGPNGCGKSTLANLLPRFYDPDEGSILIDGHDLRRLDTRQWRARIGVVTQEPVLFNDTVANNIGYGMPAATPAQIRQAAEMARRIASSPAIWPTVTTPSSARAAIGFPEASVNASPWREPCFAIPRS